MTTESKTEEHLADTKPCPHCGQPVEVYGPLGALYILKQCPTWLLKNAIKSLKEFLAKKEANGH